MSPLKQVETAYLALGSNLGDRLWHLAEAYKRLKADPCVQSVRGSQVYETLAVGLKDAPSFLNAVLEIKTEHTSESLLTCVHNIEKTLGRVRTEVVSSRTLDIDILLYGSLHQNLERLTIPHPRMTKRAFVLMTLMDLSKHLLVDDLTLTDWLKLCDTSGVKRLYVTLPWNTEF